MRAVIVENICHILVTFAVLNDSDRVSEVRARMLKNIYEESLFA